MIQSWESEKKKRYLFMEQDFLQLKKKKNTEHKYDYQDMIEGRKKNLDEK